MDNIFKNAYFGKPYKTRDGRKAIYIEFFENSAHIIVHRLISEGPYGKRYVNIMQNGNVFPFREDKDDIVSEWKESISEEELDELARADADKYCIPNTSEWNTRYTAFKVGCHLIMEEQL